MTSNPDPVVIRELERLDYARAARASLAQVERDAAALDAVLTEAHNDTAGAGMVRLAIALAAQAGGLAVQLHGDDAAGVLLGVLDAANRLP
ncbi:hypothetical protein ICV35_10645 [Rhodococcus ruber]|uniref:hypothetical protein n=1 Tax=Rhodococcus ruber TaxID=1830 RepID=UPI001780A3AC|nr:hypothetical protein [Rhodococcus ruber]MBD8054131.1 hypothetical protein [Rhodococcus ruber]WKK13028.1 hypothetical protein QYN14_05375 [Rhodococcus ruber]